MESTTANEQRVPESRSIWQIILQAFVGVIVVGAQVLDHWGTSDLYGKFMGIAVLLLLVSGPTMALRRQRSGKEVSFSNLATTGYMLVWVTAYVLTRHSR